MGRSANQKRSGNVVTLRVNPKDCMSAVDLVRAAGIHTGGMSFSMLISLAFSSAMQTFRDQGIIPDREGWEYGELVAPFIRGEQQRKLVVAKTIATLGSEMPLKGVSGPLQENVRGEATPTLTPAQLERFAEINTLKETIEDGGPGEWSPALEDEWQHYFKIVYPHG